MPQQLTRMSTGDIRLGEALKHSVYDQHGTLLLRQGIVVNIPAQIERLIAQGCYFDSQDVERNPSAAPPPVEARVPVYVRAEELSAKLKSLMVSLFRIPEQTDANAKCQEIALALREACTQNAAYLLAALQFDNNAPYLVYHQLMGAVLAEQVGRMANLGEAERNVIIAAALTRDLGMASIQAEVEKVHGPLPEALLAQVKSHPERSIEILKKAGVTDQHWLSVVAQHHERTDGSGYRKLAEPAICKGARLVGVCDMFSAMIKRRPYRAEGKAKIAQTALREIYTLGGKGLDAEFSALLIKVVGIIPPGSIVKLKNNEIALVTEPISNPKAANVLTIYDRNQMPVLEPSLRNTSQPDHEIVGMLQQEECRSAQLIIRNILMKG